VPTRMTAPISRLLMPRMRSRLEARGTPWCPTYWQPARESATPPAVCRLQLLAPHWPCAPSERLNARLRNFREGFNALDDGFNDLWIKLFLFSRNYPRCFIKSVLFSRNYARRLPVLIGAGRLGGFYLVKNTPFGLRSDH